MANIKFVRDLNQYASKGRQVPIYDYLVEIDGELGVRILSLVK